MHNMSTPPEGTVHFTTHVTAEEKESTQSNVEHRNTKRTPNQNNCSYSTRHPRRHRSKKVASAGWNLKSCCWERSRGNSILTASSAVQECRNKHQNIEKGTKERQSSEFRIGSVLHHEDKMIRCNHGNSLHYIFF